MLAIPTPAACRGISPHPPEGILDFRTQSVCGIAYTGKRKSEPPRVTAHSSAIQEGRQAARRFNRCQCGGTIAIRALTVAVMMMAV